MRISVILPTKDRGPDIDQTLAALRDQSVAVADYEVIVVDNASSPENGLRLRRWCEQNPDVFRYLPEPAPGLNHARNAGVRAARGDVLAFLDDDAVPDQTWLAALDQVFEQHAAAWAVGGRVVSRFTSEPPSWLDATFDVYLSAFDRGDSVRPLHYDDLPRGANMAFRKPAFEQCGLFATRLDRRGDMLLSNGDIEMCYRVERAGHDVLYAPDARVLHLIRGDRLDQQWFRRRAYWQGRSQALFERMHFGAAHLIRKLPYRLLRTLVSASSYRRAMHRGLCAGTLRHLFENRIR